MNPTFKIKLIKVVYHWSSRYMF